MRKVISPVGEKIQQNPGCSFHRALDGKRRCDGLFSNTGNIGHKRFVAGLGVQGIRCIPIVGCHFLSISRVCRKSDRCNRERGNSPEGEKKQQCICGGTSLRLAPFLFDFYP
jgi:hypothetical protein